MLFDRLMDAVGSDGQHAVGHRLELRSQGSEGRAQVVRYVRGPLAPQAFLLAPVRLLRGLEGEDGRACRVLGEEATLVATYTNDGTLDERARAYLEIFIIRDEMFKERYITEMIQRYQVNGILFHDSKTCPNNSNNRYGMPERLQKLNIPNIPLHADLNDLRCYSEEQGRTNIEAFMEQLGG